MKKLFLALVALLCLATAQADILSNGDFSDGKSHWEGNLRAASEQHSNGVASLDHPNNTSGVIVDLKPAWTQISQVFNSHETAFTYKITYQLSDDYVSDSSLIPKKDQGPRSARHFLSQLFNASVMGDAHPPGDNELLLIVIDTANLTFQKVTLPLDPATKGHQQTFTGTLDEIGAHDNKTLYLVFPSGQGSVTLFNVTLTPLSEQKTSPADSPPHP